MSYSRTNWVDGDLITAEKLNNIESEIGQTSAIPTITITAHNGEETTYSADKTYQELYDCFKDDSLPNAQVYLGHCAIFLDEGAGFPTTPFFGQVFLTQYNISGVAYRIFTDSNQHVNCSVCTFGITSENYVVFSRHQITLGEL